MPVKGQLEMNLQTTTNNTQRYRKRINAWHGLNTTDSAKDGEMTAIRNLCTDDYPTIKTRKARSVLSEYAGKEVTDIYDANGHLVVVADGMLYYDGEPLLSVGNGKKQFALVNTKLVIWPDKIVLDLNDGKASQMEAYTIGTAVIDEAGGEFTFAGGGAIQHGTRSFYRLAPDYTDYVIYTYEGLDWTEGHGFSYTSRSMKSTVPIFTPEFFQEGDYFIPVLSGGEYVPKAAPRGYLTPDVLTGNIYGVVLSHKYRRFTYDLDEENIVTYAIYDASGGSASLPETFAPGETVRLEGFTIKANNKKAIKLDGVYAGRITLPEGSLISSAYYYNAAADVPPGLTKLVWNHTEQGTTVQTLIGGVQLKRTIRKGEQIYVTGGDIIEGSYDYIDTTGCKAYVYDPETMITEELEFDTTVSSEIQTLNCKITLPTTENENVVIRREIPDMDFICEHENRLWGVSNEETDTIWNPQTGEYNEVKSRVIFGSALGEPKRMYEYIGASTDSYAVAVGGNGDFTGICSYNGALLAWKEDLLCKLTGSYPAEYYLRTYQYDGVASGSEHSLQTINGVLYYLSLEGVMAFYGEAPQLIGEKIGLKKLASAVAGRGRTSYYISAAHEDGTWMNAVYDFVHGLWTSEEDQRIIALERIGNHCYAVISGTAYKFEDDSAAEEITWAAELAVIDEDTFYHKRYNSVTIEAYLGQNATISLDYKNELDGEWKAAELAWPMTNNERVRRYVIDTRRSARLYLRISGSGYCKLYALEREYSMEAER